MKIREVIFKEQATAGATSAGNIASVVSPQIAIGPDRFKTSKNCATKEKRWHSQRSTQFARD